jgi:7-keto-8-aminopelargonate synthetase-like enzyme
MASHHVCCRVFLLQAAEQNVRQLQQLSEQLQQLAAAVQAATPPVTQPSRDQHQAWAIGLQDQAKQAAAALQQQVTAAVRGPCPGLLCPSQQHQQTQEHIGELNRLLQPVRFYALPVSRPTLE